MKPGPQKHIAADPAEREKHMFFLFKKKYLQMMGSRFRSMMIDMQEGNYLVEDS